ncbi:E3 ubiquitin-protein ligase CHIP-like [Actinia tenebrosa]|uniref:E3 ubiquitin-protein ligase CHIP n=1 Tax=Actinia tenebrosa TaxID=6105 RepID=A0A6P8I617_ACTTE|nr:E3 ubiquitin-protein ligase CHIP-like [Actinia tenebrosa]
MSAAELKDQGNRLFSAKQFDDAVQCYTKAIIKNSTVPTYFTNRALCHLKLKKWNQAILDSRQALDLDGNLVKAHFFLGQALLEQECYDESIAALKRAFDLAKEQKLNFGDDIASAYRMAKKRRFAVAEEKRILQEVELQKYLNKLVIEDRERSIAAMKESTLDDEEKDAEIQNIDHEAEKRLSQISDLFAEVDDRRKKREVPDALCGRISFEIMKDPVITPSGITYDKKVIEEHLQRVGHFDPVTRTDLRQEQLIPNLAMKDIIDDFVTKNEWVVAEY